MHTITPAMISERADHRGGRVTMAFGVMGGDYQPIGQGHVLTSIVDAGMDPQQAIDFPRAHVDAAGVVIERSYGDDVARALRGFGHRVRWADEPLGGAQAIWIDHDRGCLVGGSDRRKDGIALGVG